MKVGGQIFWERRIEEMSPRAANVSRRAIGGLAKRVEKAESAAAEARRLRAFVEEQRPVIQRQQRRSWGVRPCLRPNGRPRCGPPACAPWMVAKGRQMTAAFWTKLPGTPLCDRLRKA